MGELVEIRDRGSRRLLGWGPNDYRIYSDPVDAAVPQSAADEDRNDLIRALSTYEKVNNTRLGKYFGITRQRIQQIIRERVPELS